MVSAMENQLTKQAIIAMAYEVARITHQIITGQIKPYDVQVQEWAMQLFLKLPPIEESSSPLLVAITDCLVNILTCDNAPWDTPLEAFQECLDRLERLIRNKSF
jgi:hypothetical protein